MTISMWRGHPALQALISPQNTYSLAYSIAGVRWAAKQSGAAGIMFYDAEQWQWTPAAEQANQPWAIAQASIAAHKYGRLFGAAPSIAWLGTKIGKSAASCSFNLQNSIIPQIDWSNVDYFNIQAEQFVNGTNCGTANVAEYAAFVSAIDTYIKSKNPNTYVSTQLSLNDTQPATILAAIAAVQGHVDSVYVAYPAPNCAYCTVANASMILHAL